MNDGLKEWKLVQGVLGLVAATALGFYVTSGNFQAREWFPFLPASPTPDTLIFHAARMREEFQRQRFPDALREAEWVLKRDKANPEAIRTRAASLMRVGRFAEAETVFRELVGKDKKDIAARLALATALRGKGDEDRARGILLRVLRDAHADTLQMDTARASLNAMDFKEPLFADQPTLAPYKPSPKATPSPEPRKTITVSPIGASLSALLGARPTPVPLGLQRPHPTPAPTPEPPVAALLLLPTPKPQGRSVPPATEPDELGPIIPLEIPGPETKKPAAKKPPKTGAPGTPR